jgi:hypothetical protein
MSIRSCLLLLALVALASASQRVYRDFSQDVVEGINPSAPGRRIPMEVVATIAPNGQRRMVRQNPCKTRVGAMSAADQRACRAQITQNKHRAVQKKLTEAAPTLPPYTGYLVNAQWDGRTFPDVEWALDITRQSTIIYYPGEPEELQLQVQYRFDFCTHSFLRPFHVHTPEICATFLGSLPFSSSAAADSYSLGPRRRAHVFVVQPADA